MRLLIPLLLASAFAASVVLGQSPRPSASPAVDAAEARRVLTAGLHAELDPAVRPDTPDGYVRIPRFWYPPVCPVCLQLDAQFARIRARHCRNNQKTLGSSLELLQMDAHLSIAGLTPTSAPLRVLTIDRSVREYLKAQGYSQTVVEDANPDSNVVPEFSGGYVLDHDERRQPLAQGRYVLLVRERDWTLFCMRHGAGGDGSAREQLRKAGVTDPRWLAAADPAVYPRDDQGVWVPWTAVAAVLSGFAFLTLAVGTRLTDRAWALRHSVRFLVWGGFTYMAIAPLGLTLLAIGLVLAAALVWSLPLSALRPRERGGASPV